jgi:hypothetical protein
VVLWSDFPQGRADGNRMTYVHGDHLVDWLREQPARLNAQQIGHLAAFLRPGQRRLSAEPAAPIAN